MDPRPDARLGPEFSRPLPTEALEALDEEGRRERIEAGEAERAALARRLGLVALDRLVAELELRLQPGGKVIEVTGQLEAEVTQTCVVSLVPLERRLSEAFTALYTSEPAEDDDPDVDMEAEDLAAEDPPEPLGPEGLDLGEAVAQQLAVALDPYPRGEGVSLEALDWKERGEEAGEDSPFGALRSLRPES